MKKIDPNLASKLISMVFILLMLFGCDDTKKEKGKLDEQREIMMEDITLLATKYGIEGEKLIKILDEYEVMAKGYSLIRITESTPSKKESRKPKLTMEKVRDVSETLDILSEKYNISKQKLSSIIIEEKMLKIKEGK